MRRVLRVVRNLGGEQSPPFCRSRESSTKCQAISARRPTSNFLGAGSRAGKAVKGNSERADPDGIDTLRILEAKPPNPLKSHFVRKLHRVRSWLFNPSSYPSRRAKRHTTVVRRGGFPLKTYFQSHLTPHALTIALKTCLIIMC